ncbi:MAG: YicC/YloC family endoribonuclease [Alkalispirochaetaceae bacterium]
MKSMTGYAYREEQRDGRSYTIEVKAWNNRYLDVSVGLPPFLNPLEPRIRERVSAQVRRGKIDVWIKLRELASDPKVSVDAGAAEAYLGALQKLKAETSLEGEIRIEHLLAFEGLLTVEKSRDLEAIWAELLPPLEDALAQFEEVREREGAATYQDIAGLLERIDREVGQIDTKAPELEERILSTIRNRFREVLGEQAEEQRIYAEAASLMVKHSIHEEVSRLRAHLEAFRLTMQENEPVGKRLDFICQEMNREINTISSKSIEVDIHNSVIEVKDNLEKVREQLRNVE